MGNCIHEDVEVMGDLDTLNVKDIGIYIKKQGQEELKDSKM